MSGMGFHGAGGPFTWRDLLDVPGCLIFTTLGVGGVVWLLSALAGCVDGDAARKECEARPGCHYIGTLNPGEAETLNIRVPVTVEQGGGFVMVQGGGFVKLYEVDRSCIFGRCLVDSIDYETSTRTRYFAREEGDR